MRAHLPLPAAILVFGVVGFPVATWAQSSEEPKSHVSQEAKPTSKQEWKEKAAQLAEITRNNPQDAKAWLQLGYALHAAGDLEEAIQANKRAATFEATRPTGLYNLGCALALKGEGDAAFAALEKATKAGFADAKQLKSDPDLVSLREDERFASLLAHVVAQENAKECQKKARPAAALAAMTKGKDFIKREDWASAAYAFEEAIQVDPDYPEAWLQLGDVRHAMGEIDLARDAFAKAAESPRFEPEALYKIACGHAKAGDNGLALKFLEKAFSVGYDDTKHLMGDPDFTALREDARFTALANKMAAKATRGKKKGEGWSEDMAPAQQLIERREWGKAILALEKITEKDPENGWAWFQLGYALAASGDLERAIGANQEAANHDKYRPSAAYNIACAYSRLGDKDRAFAALEEASRAGFHDRALVEKDSDLDPLRDDVRFAAFVESLPPMKSKTGSRFY